MLGAGGERKEATATWWPVWRLGGSQASRASGSCDTCDAGEITGDKVQTGCGAGLAGISWKASHDSGIEAEIERPQENGEGKDVPGEGHDRHGGFGEGEQGESWIAVTTRFIEHVLCAPLNTTCAVQSRLKFL